VFNLYLFIFAPIFDGFIKNQELFFVIALFSSKIDKLVYNSNLISLFVIVERTLNNMSLSSSTCSRVPFIV